MHKLQVIALLIAVSLTLSSEYFLSPPLPPTTYQGQYYTVQFRVVGMSNPIFYFDNLPECFTAYENGTIEGIPDKIGSFAIKVNFKSNHDSGAKDIVIRVVASVNDPSQLKNAIGNQLVKTFMVVNSNLRLTYQAGDTIELTLYAINGKEPYTWNYINLPPQLSGNASGVITGKFDKEGYYTFSASASDSLGSIADSFFTLNIQPAALVKGSQLVEVPNIVSIRYDLQQVEEQEITATKALFECVNNLNWRQNLTNFAKNVLNKTTQAVKLAKAQDDKVSLRAANAIKSRNNAQVNLENAHSVVLHFQNNVAQAQLNLQNAQAIVLSSLQRISSIQSTANQSQIAYSQATNSFIQAQSASTQAAEALLVKISADISARNDLNLAFTSLSNRKQDIQDTRDQKQRADIIVANARNAVNLARQMNDDAQSNLTSTQQIAQLTLAALDYSNQVVAQLQSRLSTAGDELGTAKYNYNEAINMFYIAQAKKEQADKATQIVLAQTSTQASTYMFAGCEQQAYPTITGSATIISTYTNQFQLSSGHHLVFGSCTQGEDNANVGDIINFVGYLKNGYVQCTSFKKFNGASL